MQSTRMADQLRRNRVALISLVVAITSLTYNTWRNEASEDNRTQRLVSISVLEKLADLQELVWHNHYDGDAGNLGNLRSGWAIVIAIRDISTVLGKGPSASATMLWEVWDKHSATLAASTDSKDAIIEAIETCRAEVLELLQELD